MLKMRVERAEDLLSKYALMKRGESAKPDWSHAEKTKRKKKRMKS